MFDLAFRQDLLKSHLAQKNQFSLNMTEMKSIGMLWLSFYSSDNILN